MFRISYGGGDADNLTNSDENNELHNDVNKARNTLLHNLRSYESVIHHMQQLLVWEKPLHSVVFVLLLHAVFWYLNVRSSHAIGLLSTIVLIVIWLDMWKHKIWPEIRAIDPDPENEEWGELHPHLLSLPEICKVLAECYINLRCYFKAARECREHLPVRFVTLTIAGCTLLLLLGRTIPGSLLAYAIMICVCAWPLMWYHRLLEKAYSKMEPFLMQLQYSLKPRMKTKGKRGKHVTKEIDGTSVEVHTDSSSDDDDDMSEFLKPMDAVTAEVFARALTDDDELSESDESLLAHELPSFSHPVANIFTKGSNDIHGVPLPIKPPQFDDPEFAKEILNESEEDGSGLISDPDANNLAKQIAVSVAANTMTNAIANVFNSTNLSSLDKKKNSDSNSSSTDDDFVILDGR